MDIQVSEKGTPIYNVYDIDGQRLLYKATSLSSLSVGLYIVNGKKTLIQ